MHRFARVGYRSAMIATPPPTLVEVRRGSTVESRHRGAVAVAAPDGRPAAAVGDPTLPVTLRSGVKPLAIAALGPAGAIDAFALSDEELALMASSHSGSDRAVEIQRRLLERLGIARDVLRNPPSLPSDEEARARLIVTGDGPGVLRHMCSGFHLASVVLSLYAGWPLEGYLDAGHPSQRAAREVVVATFGEPIDESIDDCGLPTWTCRLEQIARGYSFLANPEAAAAEGRLEPALARALARIRDAMVREPELIAGPDQTSTLLIRAAAGRLVAKEGAEGLLGIGVSCGGGNRGTGALDAFGPVGGVAITIEDGDRMRRATPIVAIEALRQLGVLAEPLPASLEARRRPVSQDGLGRAVGEALPVFRLEPAGA